MDNFFEELKEIVKKYSSKIPEENIDCWPKMRDKFPEFMKNKINNFLPIFQKCVKVAEEYLDINNIRVKFKEETDFKEPAKYEKYLSDISDFKEYQDGITIKNIISNFYENRNKLFHGGKITDKWSLKSDRYEANFIKILEQLFFRILGLDMICFYQMGYPHQKIFGIPGEEDNLMNLGNLSQNIMSYIHEHHILSKKIDFKKHFNDLEIALEHYIDKEHDLDSLWSQLNSLTDKVIAFLRGNHPVYLVIDGDNYNHSLNYQDIKDGKIPAQIRL